MNEPTNFTESSSSVIDLLIRSHKQSIFLCGVDEPFVGKTCDITVQFCVYLTLIKPLQNLFCRHVWLYDKENYEELREEINNANWQTLKDRDIDTYASNVTNHIISISKNSKKKQTKKHIPNKEIIVHQSDPEWLTSKLKKMMRKRKRLYDKYQRTKRVTDYTAYKIFRNKVTSELRRAKKLVTIGKP